MGAGGLGAHQSDWIAHGCRAGYGSRGAARDEGGGQGRDRDEDSRSGRSELAPDGGDQVCIVAGGSGCLHDWRREQGRAGGSDPERGSSVNRGEGNIGGTIGDRGTRVLSGGG